LAKAIEMDYDYLKAYVRAPSSYFARIAQTAHWMGVASGSHFIAPGIQTGMTGTTHLSATNRAGFNWGISAGGKSYKDVIDLYSKGDFDLCSTHGGRQLVGDRPELIQDDRFKYLMPRNFAVRYINDAQNPTTDAELASIKLRAVPAAYILKEGGLVALGTDSPVLAPGLGLQMSLLAFTHPDITGDVGVSTHQALQTVTINSAKLSHADHELGTVEKGKIADLIMIRGNPLEDVANVMNVEMVMKNGVIYTQEDILSAYPNEVE
jgi:hypothetical protein